MPGRALIAPKSPPGGSFVASNGGIPPADYDEQTKINLQLGLMSFSGGQVQMLFDTPQSLLELGNQDPVADRRAVIFHNRPA